MTTYPAPVNDALRGHTFYPPAHELATIPQYEDLHPDEVTIHLHYFAPNSDVYVAAFDPTTGLAYGWGMIGHRDPSHGDWGDFSLPEIEQFRATRGIGWFERDLHFTPGPAKTVLPRREPEPPTTAADET
ncbi:hypothetical protein [Embleya sp. NPDC059237]|uniref:hypothetical protein n=1 Tax=Embleya sp. NPDC059237 TaxID=3346784 RepID=UPI00367B455D